MHEAHEAWVRPWVRPAACIRVSGEDTIGNDVLVPNVAYQKDRKYGHTDKLLTDLSFVDEGALVQQWFDTQPESSKSLPGRKRSFERKFRASDRQPHMKKQKSAAVDSGIIPHDINQQTVDRGSAVRAYRDANGAGDFWAPQQNRYQAPVANVDAVADI